jgi:hypothetical protein
VGLITKHAATILEPGPSSRKPKAKVVLFVRPILKNSTLIYLSSPATRLVPPAADFKFLNFDLGRPWLAYEEAVREGEWKFAHGMPNVIEDVQPLSCLFVRLSLSPIFETRDGILKDSRDPQELNVL